MFDIDSSLKSIVVPLETVNQRFTCLSMAYVSPR